MGIGASIFLLAVGAILAFAVETTVAGVDIQTIGIILMVAGVLGLLITVLSLSSLGDRRRGTEPEDRPVEREVVRERPPR